MEVLELGTPVGRRSQRDLEETAEDKGLSFEREHVRDEAIFCGFDESHDDPLLRVHDAALWNAQGGLCIAHEYLHTIRRLCNFQRSD